MTNCIFLDIGLGAIKEFFNRVIKNVDAEIVDICSKKDAGEFTEPDDFDSALFYPLETEAIAVRAVFHEVNALVESELHTIANKPYSDHPKHMKNRKFLKDTLNRYS